MDAERMRGSRTEGMREGMVGERGDGLSEMGRGRERVYKKERREGRREEGLTIF